MNMDNFLSTLLYLIQANTILFICQALTIFVVLKLIVDKKSASNILAWLLAILFIPYIAIPFFLIFKRKNKHNSWEKEAIDITHNFKNYDFYKNYEEFHNLPRDTINVFNNMGLQNLTKNNSFKIYTDGVESFESFIQSINLSKKNIYIQNFQLFSFRSLQIS